MSLPKEFDYIKQGHVELYQRLEFLTVETKTSEGYYFEIPYLGLKLFSKTEIRRE